MRRSRLALVLLGVALAILVFGAAELALRLLGVGERRELREFHDLAGPAGPAGGATLLTREPSWTQMRSDHGAALDRIAVARAKPPGTWRVVIVGESTVAGFPFYPELSFGRLLEASLRDSFPDLPIEVVNFGRVADPSDAVAQAAIEALDVAPDLLVVCSGHNDYQASYVDDLRDGLWPRLRAQLRKLRLVQVGFHRVLSREAPVPAIAEGKRVGDQPWLTVSEFERGARRFRGNLESILDAARARAVDVALVTPVSNLRDFAPCYSHYTRRLSDSEKREYERLLGELESQIAATLLPFESAQTVERLRSLDPGVALAAYLAAKRAERTGKASDASFLYALALELDGYPNRARAALSQVVRDVAVERGARLVDAELAFSAAARGPAPGSDLFLDYCHPTPEAMALLADAVRPAVLEALARAGAPLPLRHAERPMLERRTLDDWLARLGLSRRQVVDGLVKAAQGMLVLHLGLPANRESLRLARNAFDQALRIVPDHVDARQGRLAIDLLDGERDAALARASELQRDAPDSLRKVEEVARDMAPLREALSRLGLEFRDGRLQPATEGH